MQINDDYSIFYAIETKKREFKARVLFSLFASKRGFKTIIGEKNKLKNYILNQDNINGAYIHKSSSKRQFKRFQLLREKGLKIFVNDEEGLIYYSLKHYKKRFDSNVAKDLDGLFCWGENHLNDIKLIEPNFPLETTHVTGNPRFDLIRLYNNVNKTKFDIDNEHNKIILINTNFALANHFKGNEYIEGIKQINNHSSINDKLSYQKNLFASFKQAIINLSNEFPELKFVLRPHPSESIKKWESEIKGIQNVVVNNEKNVFDVLNESRCVIHNSCTTSLEAIALGVMPIAYRPITNDIFDSEITNIASIQAKTIEDLVSAIKNVGSVNQQEEIRKNRQSLLKYIANIEGTFSCERMLDVIEQSILNGENNSTKRLSNRKYSLVKKYIARLRDKFNFSMSEYAQHKFPGLTRSEIVKEINKIREFDSSFPDVKITKVWPDCFEIAPLDKV